MAAVQVSNRKPRAWLTIVGAFLAIGAGHLLVGRTTHPQHVVHLVFGAAYLLPIVAAAAWLGARQAVLLSAGSAAIYLLHASSQASDAMERANQVVLAAIYLFVGLVSAVLVAAADRERRARLESERTAQRDATVQAIASLSGALRERDDGAAAHSDRVASVAESLGGALGLSPERLHVLRLAALVHDVGKIGVRDDVLFKPGELTPEERGRIERHPVIAADILRPIRGAEEIAEIVLAHHECPDGSGYPRGLSGARIPSLARILRVADVFAALIEQRPYKSLMSPVEALSRMRELGARIDPGILATLERLVAGGMRIDPP